MTHLAKNRIACTAIFAAGKKILLLVCVAIVLSGCNSSTPTIDLTSEEAALQLMSTGEFIPTLEKDKEGLLIPYEPQVNPYEALRGRIKKESVAQFIQAQRAFKAENYGEAKSILESLVEHDTKLSGPWVMLGDIELKGEGGKPNLVEAEAAYNTAIGITPENINAYLKLALVQRKLGKFLHAQNTYAAVLAVWKDFPEAHLNLAILYDLYLNHPIRAQKHMEAYQFLTDGENTQVSMWLENLQQRTGIAPSLEPVSVALTAAE